MKFMHINWKWCSWSQN